MVTSGIGRTGRFGARCPDRQGVFQAGAFQPAADCFRAPASRRRGLCLSRPDASKCRRDGFRFPNCGAAGFRAAIPQSAAAPNRYRPAEIRPAQTVGDIRIALGHAARLEQQLEAFFQTVGPRDQEVAKRVQSVRIVRTQDQFAAQNVDRRLIFPALPSTSTKAIRRSCVSSILRASVA